MDHSTSMSTHLEHHLELEHAQVVARLVREQMGGESQAGRREGRGGV
jgi:hypothetical protein